MPIIKTNLRAIAKDGLLPPTARKEIRLDTARKIDLDLRRGAARGADKMSDDFVAFNFNRTWRQGAFQPGEAIGRDYDYYGAVLQEALDLYRRWSPSRDPDPTGLKWYGPAPGDYRNSYKVWQNGKEVSWGTPLTGPSVDFGPTVDYALYIERWDTGGPPNTELLQRIGIMHAIARALARRWEGVHKVYVGTTALDGPAEFERKNRAKKGSEPRKILPYVRIMPRHYQR